MSAPRAFRHFLNYHNPDSMGYEFVEISSFAIVTNKKIRDLEGDRIWLVGRRGANDFFLYGSFRAETVEVGDFDGFKCKVSASKGEWIKPAVQLNGLEWFSPLKEQMANFSLGFQSISDKSVVEQFHTLRAKHGRQAMSGADISG